MVLRMSKQTRFDGDAGFPRDNKKEPQKIPPEKLFSDLLKRQARRVMQDVTECPPVALSAHMDRINDLRELFEHVIRHQFAETAESALSGAQLLYPSTLADFLACLDITKREHRAPPFVNSRDAELEQINRKLDMLAGFIMRDEDAQRFFSEFRKGGAE